MVPPWLTPAYVERLTRPTHSEHKEKYRLMTGYDMGNERDELGRLLMAARELDHRLTGGVPSRAIRYRLAIIVSEAYAQAYESVGFNEEQACFLSAICAIVEDGVPAHTIESEFRKACPEIYKAQDRRRGLYCWMFGVGFWVLVYLICAR